MGSVIGLKARVANQVENELVKEGSHCSHLVNMRLQTVVQFGPITVGRLISQLFP